MAIFISGTKCKTCGKTIDNVTDAVLFPAFIINEVDPLIVFNDSAMHRVCFSKHPDNSRVTELLRQLECKINSQNRVCDLCHNRIMDPDDYLLHACLSSRRDELSEYNCKQYHKSCFVGSILQKRIKALINKLKDDGLWSSKLQI